MPASPRVRTIVFLKGAGTGSEEQGRSRVFATARTKPKHGEWHFVRKSKYSAKLTSRPLKPVFMR